MVRRSVCLSKQVARLDQQNDDVNSKVCCFFYMADDRCLESKRECVTHTHTHTRSEMWVYKCASWVGRKVAGFLVSTRTVAKMAGQEGV